MRVFPHLLPFEPFLDASSHLYKWVCPSVRPSVHCKKLIRRIPTDPRTRKKAEHVQIRPAFWCRRSCPAAPTSRQTLLLTFRIG